MRHYDKGVLVGEQDPPIDFVQWLRGEIQQAQNTEHNAPGHVTIAGVAATARRQALNEVLRAYEDSRRNDAEAAE